MFRAASKQRMYGLELALFTAWNVAAFSRQKRLRPWASIKKQLTDAETEAQTKPHATDEASGRRPHAQTPAEMHVAMQLIAAQINAKKAKATTP